jgi:hypothetical protein
MEITADDLANAIKHELSKDFIISEWTDEQIDSDTYWTRRLRSALQRAGAAYDVRCSDGDRSNPGMSSFLYDICWLDTGRNQFRNTGYFREDSPLKRLILVGEHEWNYSTDEIVYDFSKLLVARAALRFMAFYKKRTQDLILIVEQLRAAIRSYSDGSETDRYLIAAFGKQLDGFSFYLLDGRGRDVTAAI